MKQLYKYVSGLLLAGLCQGISAQVYLKPTVKVRTSSFAIITDRQTWKQCTDELKAYQAALDAEQLPTFIVYDDWKNPEAVKSVIRRLYKKEKLEGVVFVGDIPIAMIRKAQHLTSAFKMDEANAWFDSSVPSDRFYDDLHLKFDFLKEDSVKQGYFYYDLSVDSPQEIKCDLYSARIKPVKGGGDRYRQLKRALTKIVAAHRESNKLDQFFSYTGEGSYSNSLTAWTPEAFTLREQMPQVFDREGRARFLRYSFSDYPKNDVINMLKRKELDVAIFHEHGTPDRQYLSATPPTATLDEHIHAMQSEERSDARYFIKNRKALEERYRTLDTTYGLDSSWVTGYNDPKIRTKDSLDDLRTGLVLSDITEACPNVRMVILDACYNGDFREDDYIAGRYLMADGDCVVTFGNTVNVLQDKQANELLGMLGFGARVGQWAQLTNILESHITGDPTLRFTSNQAAIDLARLNLRTYDEKSMVAWLDSPYADVQNLALHRLYRHGYKHLSSLLRERFEHSSFATVRYTCLALLEKLNDDNFREALIPALNDPNEFIRRYAVNKMGRVGLNEYVPHLVKAFADDQLATRISFNIQLVLPVFDEATVRRSIDDEFRSGRKIPAEEQAQLLAAYRRRTDSDKQVLNQEAKERWRILYINSLKNINIHASVDGYLHILNDVHEPDTIKTALLQALAWFKYSYRRTDILQACDALRRSKHASDRVRREAERTYYRLKD